MADKPVADVVHYALTQAIVAGGAALADEGWALTLQGELTEVSVSEKDGGFEVTIRMHISLKRGSQTAFDTVILGRASDEALDQGRKSHLGSIGEFANPG